MSLPRWYFQIERMIENEALQTKMARAIVRKAGLRPSASGNLALAEWPVTIVDAFIMPDLGANAWQFSCDLSGFTQIRFVSRGERTLFLYYSQADSTALDPGDYQALRATRIADQAANVAIAADSTDDLSSHNLKWFTIPEGLRVPLRLSVSDSDTGWGFNVPSFPEADRQGFSLGVQIL